MRSDRPHPIESASTSRSAIRFVAPVLISLSVMLMAAAISIEVLSTVRAWVGGESLYSKGQNKAVYYLGQYAISNAEADYRQYEAAIALPTSRRVVLRNRRVLTQLNT